MLGTIKNFAMRLVGSMPLLGKIVPKNNLKQKEKKIKLQSHTPLHNLNEYMEDGFIIPVKSKKNEYSEIDKVIAEDFEKIISEQQNRIFYPGSDYQNICLSIQKKIKRVDDNAKARINFHIPLIKSELSILQNHLSANFEEKLKALNKSKIDLSSPDKYLAVSKQYLIENLRLCVEIENQIFKRILQEPINGNIVDVSNGFSVCQELSKHVLSKALETFATSLNFLPSVSFSTSDGSSSHLKNYISQELKDFIRTSFIGSKFGLHDKKLVTCFSNKLKNFNFNDDEELFRSLLALSKFQRSIHGTILQDPINIENAGQEIAELDEELIKTCLDEMISSIEQEFQVRTDYKIKINTSSEKEDEKLLRKSKDKRDLLRYNIANLQNFLRHVGITEVEKYTESKRISNSDIWTKLDYNPVEEARVIEKAYAELLKTVYTLGEINEDDLVGNQYKKLMLEVMNNDDSFKKHFKRIIFEVKTIAAIDAISSYRNRKPVDDSFKEKNRNFVSIPWLSELYDKSFDKYKQMIEEDISVEKTMDVAEYLSQLGNELHQIGLFEANNLFKRYGIEDYAEKMLIKMGELTEVGVIAVMIDLYSNLFSYLNMEDKSLGLEPNEIRGLRRLIRFLRKISTIYDKETGEIILNPPRDNSKRSKLAKQTYDKMADIIGDKGFLMSETDLILKFFRMALQDKKIRGESQDDKYQLLEAKYTILASWLLYILVKFLPKESNDVEALKARVKVLSTLLNDELQTSKDIPSSLRPKINLNLYGYNNGVSAEKTERLGIVSEIADELENKIQKHIDKEKCPIALKDLLYIYKEVENIFKKNPKTVKEAQKLRVENFNNHKPLLLGLDEVCSRSLITAPKLIVKFAKETNEDRIIKKVGLELLNNIQDSIQAFKQSNGEGIKIYDSDKETIQAMSKVLIYSQYLGYLMNPGKSKNFILRTNHFINKAEDQQNINDIENKIASLNEFFTRKVTLLRDERYKLEEEAFKDQLLAKNILLELLNKTDYRIRPGLGNKFEWLSSRKERKLKENQTTYSIAA